VILDSLLVFEATCLVIVVVVAAVVVLVLVAVVAVANKLRPPRLQMLCLENLKGVCVVIEEQT
jgi:hypothetical protein